jgi:transcription initiation factor TFIID TATA-box-binding protein
LNLRKIATEGMHVEYKRENGMVNMRLRKPHTTATIWSSGKITCAGAKSEPDAYKAARRYSRILQKMQFRVRLTNYRVVNVLATCTLPFSIDIIRIANKFQKECSYEPELHPGATFKLKELRTTLKLFTTGSVTLTSPSVQMAQQAINHIYPMLYEYKKSFLLTSLKSEPPLKLETNNAPPPPPVAPLLLLDQGPSFSQSLNNNNSNSESDLNPHLLYETLNNSLNHHFNLNLNHHSHHSHHHQPWYSHHHHHHHSGTTGVVAAGYDSLISIDHVDDFLP